MNAKPTTNGSRSWEYVLKAMVPISLAVGGAVIAHEIAIQGVRAEMSTDDELRELEDRFRATHDALFQQVQDMGRDIQWIRKELENHGK